MPNIELSFFYQDFYQIGQILLAMLLGGLIGFQRKKSHKPAGVRTYSLIAGGAALFTIISTTSFPFDSARIIAQIVVGIGFLGAGAILHKEDLVLGLTTAAGMWVAAAIGTAVGLGMYLIALFVTILTILILMFNEEKLFKK